MSNEEENSFLLVGMSQDEQEKSIYSVINRDSSSISTKNEIKEDISSTKPNKKISKNNTSYFSKILYKLLSLDQPKKNKKEKYEEYYYSFGFFDENKKIHEKFIELV